MKLLLASKWQLQNLKIGLVKFFSNRYRFIILPLVIFIPLLIWGFLPRSEKRIELQKETIVESVFGLATIQASEVYHLRVAVPAVLLKLFVEKGDYVKEGASLARFDSFGILRSPIQGVVTQTNYDEGELITPQTPILTIMDLDQKFLSVSLEERAAVKVKVGQTVRIRFEALGNQKYLGKVKSLFPSEGQFEVKIFLDAFPIALLPGMTADIAIEISQRQAFVIPKTAILNGKIQVQSENGTNWLSVETGASTQEKIEITSSKIKAGDLVLIPD